MANVVHRGVLFLSLFLGLSRLAAADPIQVTGGTTFLYGDGSFTAAFLTGAGLNVHVDGFGGGPSILVPGLTSFDGQFIDGSVGTPHTWSPTVNGIQYEAYLDATLDFDTESILIPAVTQGNVPVSFSAPFTMTGRLRGTTGAFGTGTVLFDVLLTGSGIATASGFSQTPAANLYRVGGVNYQFSAATPEPTPEPATLLLMGTGMAGVLLRRRQRAGRNDTVS